MLTILGIYIVVGVAVSVFIRLFFATEDSDPLIALISTLWFIVLPIFAIFSTVYLLFYLLPVWIVSKIDTSRASHESN